MEYMLIIIKLNSDFWYKIKEPYLCISEVHFFKICFSTLNTKKKNESLKFLIRVMKKVNSHINVCR